MAPTDLCVDGYVSRIATGLCADFPLKRVAIFGSLVQRELPRKRVRDCRRFTIPPPPPPRLRRAELGTSLYTREAFCKCEQCSITVLWVVRRRLCVGDGGPFVNGPYGLCDFPPNGAAFREPVGAGASTARLCVRDGILTRLASRARSPLRVCAFTRQTV